MPIKTILAYVESAALSGPTLDAAIRLAKAHDAAVTGLGDHPPHYRQGFAGAHVPASLLESIEQEQEKQLATAGAYFNDRMSAAALTKSTRWTTGHDHISSLICARACYADLVVLRQAEARGDEGGYADVPDDVILGTGCRTLVVPGSWQDGPLGQSVLVAWNGSPEAARAVRDALPILAKAKRIVVLSANPAEGTPFPDGELTAFLSNHGIAAEARCADERELPVGEVIAEEIRRGDHDMLVMGGYGHSRIRETVMGGVTRYMLTHMTVPVLMSH